MPAICGACADALPFDGMAVTVMASDFARESAFCSDPVIGAVEAAQYSVGEGPSLEVFSSGRPMLLPLMSDRSVAARWPALIDQIAALPVGGLYTFPLRFGAISVGIASAYRTAGGPLESEDVEFVLQALDVMTVALMDVRHGTAGTSLLGSWVTIGSLRRQQVHQATGIVMSQLGLDPQSAFAWLRAAAFSRGLDLELFADGIVRTRVLSEGDEP